MSSLLFPQTPLPPLSEFQGGYLPPTQKNAISVGTLIATPLVLGGLLRSIDKPLPVAHPPLLSQGEPK